MSAYRLSDGQMKWNGRFVSILRTGTLKQICAQPGCQLPHQGQRGEQVGFWTSGVSARFKHPRGRWKDPLDQPCSTTPGAGAEMTAKP